jgi:hypothetical protein
MLTEKERERVTLSTPNQKLLYGVEARKTVLLCRTFHEFSLVSIFNKKQINTLKSKEK